MMWLRLRSGLQCLTGNVRLQRGLTTLWNAANECVGCYIPSKVGKELRTRDANLTVALDLRGFRCFCGNFLLLPEGSEMGSLVDTTAVEASRASRDSTHSRGMWAGLRQEGLKH